MSNHVVLCSSIENSATVWGTYTLMSHTKRREIHCEVLVSEDRRTCGLRANVVAIRADAARVEVECHGFVFLDTREVLSVVELHRVVAVVDQVDVHRLRRRADRHQHHYQCAPSRWRHRSALKVLSIKNGDCIKSASWCTVNLGGIVKIHTHTYTESGNSMQCGPHTHARRARREVLHGGKVERAAVAPVLFFCFTQKQCPVCDTKCLPTCQRGTHFHLETRCRCSSCCCNDATTEKQKRVGSCYLGSLRVVS